MEKEGFIGIVDQADTYAWESRFRLWRRKIFELTWLFVPVLSTVYPFELDPRVISDIQDWEADNKCEMKTLVRL